MSSSSVETVQKDIIVHAKTSRYLMQFSYFNFKTFAHILVNSAILSFIMALSGGHCFILSADDTSMQRLVNLLHGKPVMDALEVTVILQANLTYIHGDDGCISI